MLGFGKRNTYVFVRRQVRHRDDFVQTKFAFPHVPKLFRDSLHAVLIPIKESVNLVYRDGLENSHQLRDKTVCLDLENALRTFTPLTLLVTNQASEVGVFPKTL